MKTTGINDILIVGGGTAGWMTANLMAHKWCDYDINITLVESPEVGIIGVGEGSTPKLKDFFDALNISEEEWMPACNATYKNGINFINWSTVPGFTEYFHPFGCTIDALTYPFFRDNSILRRKGVNVDVNPNNYFLMTKLAESKLSPIAANNFPFQFDYAYHFDSALLGHFLRKKASELGVKHIEGTVVEIKQNDNGELRSIELTDGRTFAADYFVDCTGFAAILIQKTLGVRFISFAENLFNDSAIAIPTEISNNIPSETESTALKNGWAWKIPLTNRFGNGYVYSSDYSTADDAETELRSHLGMLDSEVEARHLKMRVGRAEKSWCKNCVAIGLSQGFIEPLEATALQFVHSSIESFITAFEKGGFSAAHQDQFNQQINRNFEGIRDYIVLHYQTNSRNDSEYWKDNRSHAQISENLSQMIACWNQVNNIEEKLLQLNISQYYTAISWNCMFAGTGLFPPLSKQQMSENNQGTVDLNYLKKFFTDCTLNFKPHEIQLGKKPSNELKAL